VEHYNALVCYCSPQTICRSSRSLQPGGQQPRHRTSTRKEWRAVGLRGVGLLCLGCFAWVLCFGVLWLGVLVSRVNIFNTNAASQPRPKPASSSPQSQRQSPQQASPTTATGSLLVAVIHASRIQCPRQSHWERFGPRSHLFRINDFPQDRSFILASHPPFDNQTIKPKRQFLATAPSLFNLCQTRKAPWLAKHG
jgi:hypothetical protein